MKIKNYELLVAISGDEPKPLQQYGHEGHTFVEGKPGTEFCLVFRNNTPDRVLMVPAIDGLSCMDGSPATPESEGYVVEPYRRLVVKGWRTSLEKTAAFTFERKKNGYAKAIKADTENVGVIGAMVFKSKEKVADQGGLFQQLIDTRRELEEERNRRPIIVDRPYPVYPSSPYPKPYYGDHITWLTTTSTDALPVEVLHGGAGIEPDATLTWSVSNGGTGAIMGTLQSDNSAPQSIMNCSIVRSATPAKFNLAAGWGEERADVVKEVTFTRGDLDAEFAIYYTDRKAIKEMGIDLDAKPAVTKLPQAFTRKFCKPPGK